MALVLVLGSVSWGQQCGAGGTVVANPTLVPAGSFQQVAADIVSGAFGNGGFLTKISLVNLSSSPNTVVFNDISENGALLASCSYSIPANGTLRLAEGSITGTSDVHWALVGSTAPVGVNLFFELTQNSAVVNTVGFNDLAPRSSFTFPVEFQNSPFHTLGLALANPNNSSNTVTVTLVDQGGTTLGSKQQVLPPYGHLSEDLLTSTNQLSIASFLPAGNFTGSVQVTTSAPSSTVAVGDDQGPFFSEAPMFVASNSGGGGGGGSNISASITLTPSDAINSASCIQKGVAATGATTAMAVAISPQGDPTTNGLSKVLWSAWVDAPDHVTAQFCKFATGFAVPASNQVFNIRLLTSSSSSATGSVTLASGAQVASGSCIESGAALAGASPANVVSLSPAGDPANAGLSDFQFQGYVDSPGHVTAELCKFGGGTAILSAALKFNVALLN